MARVVMVDWEAGLAGIGEVEGSRSGGGETWAGEFAMGVWRFGGVVLLWDPSVTLMYGDDRSQEDEH